MKESRCPVSLRLTGTQARLVTAYASQLGIADYAARHRIFELGLNEAFAAETKLADTELLSLLEEALARLVRLDRLSERILVTTASGYTYAQYAAVKGSPNPNQLNETLSQASMEAYRRQLEAARDPK